MYRNSIAKQMYGKELSELTEEEVVALDEAIPFQFSKVQSEEEIVAE